MRLVIVDNDPVALDLAVTDLSLEGHDIVATGVDGAEGLAACLEHRPDVLVVDYRMNPGIDGLEVTRRVLAALPDTRIVLHTNHVDADVIATCRKLGASFLTKGDLRLLRQAVGPAAG